MPSKARWHPDEPARDPDYRRAYAKMHERMQTQDGCITWLLVELRALQKRVTQLEKRNDELAAAALRLARSNVEEVREPTEMSAQP